MLIKFPGGQFGGNLVKGVQLEGLRLTETSYHPGLRISSHAHELACFVFVLRGNFSETNGRRSRECGPMTLIYRPAGEIHANRFHDAGGQCLNIELEPAWLARVRRYSARLPMLDNSADFCGGVVRRLGVRLCREFRQFDTVSPLAIEACLLEIVATATRERTQAAEPKPPRWLARSEEFLRAHYAESLEVAQVANAVNIHPAHLSRVFRAYFGCTVGDYIRRLRVEAASRELTEADHSLSEIAVATGFYDQAHFSRTFKRLTGLTPAEFRASTRTR